MRFAHAEHGRTARRGTISDRRGARELRSCAFARSAVPIRAKAKLSHGTEVTNGSHPRQMGWDPLSRRGVSRSLLLAPLLGVPGRALTARVVDHAADRRLVDEVRRSLEQRD